MQAAITRNNQLAAQMKQALRRLASTIAVVTCSDGPAWHGGDPPLMP